MEENIVDQIAMQLNWRERIVVRIFKKVFEKFCKILRREIINNFLK